MHNNFFSLVLLGEDIAFGGVFRSTEGLQEKHGLSCYFSLHHIAIAS